MLRGRRSSGCSTRCIIATGRVTTKRGRTLRQFRRERGSEKPSSTPHGVVIANGIALHTIRVRIATHCEEERFVGKVETLTYDHFGDFKGFTLETMGGSIRHFESHEPRIGELARRAWQERARIAVKVEPGDPHRPASISFVV